MCMALHVIRIYMHLGFDFFDALTDNQAWCMIILQVFSHPITYSDNMKMKWTSYCTSQRSGRDYFHKLSKSIDIFKIDARLQYLGLLYALSIFLSHLSEHNYIS